MSDIVSDFFGKGLPGYTIRLPSLGLFSEPGDFAEGTDFDNFEVRPFTVLEDLNYKSPMLIMSGKATYSMLQSVTTQIINCKNMISVDVEAIMLASRIASYGNEINMKFKCTSPEVDENKKPKCQHETSYDIALDKLLMSYPSMSISDLPNWRMTLQGNGVEFIFEFTLPTYEYTLDLLKLWAKQNQLMAVLQSDAFVDLKQEQQLTLQSDFTEVIASIQIVRLISSIKAMSNSSGMKVTDKNEISKLINTKTFPKTWYEKLLSKIDELIMPFTQAGLQDVTCEKCGHVSKGVSVLQNPEAFFTQPLGA